MQFQVSNLEVHSDIVARFPGQLWYFQSSSICCQCLWDLSNCCRNISKMHILSFKNRLLYSRNISRGMEFKQKLRACSCSVMSCRGPWVLNMVFCAIHFNASDVFRRMRPSLHKKGETIKEQWPVPFEVKNNTMDQIWTKPPHQKGFLQVKSFKLCTKAEIMHICSRLLQFVVAVLATTADISTFYCLLVWYIRETPEAEDMISAKHSCMTNAPFHFWFVANEEIKTASAGWNSLGKSRSFLCFDPRQYIHSYEKYS